MEMAFGRLRALLRNPGRSRAAARQDETACSWSALRATYQEQAARGNPQAIEGLKLIEQGRWPSSGRRREPSGDADG
jgi:hypothetical protein